jgi:hypothetical protein
VEAKESFYISNINKSEVVKMKVYKVFSAKMAHNLRKKGFWIIGTEPNMKAPQFDVFLFEDTEELQQAISEYTLTYCRK